MLRVALCQLNGKIGDVKGNIELLANTVKERSSEADLICFPELFREGYVSNKEQFADLAMDVNGPDSMTIRELAKETGVYIAFGYAERVAGAIYNAAQVISPEGDLLINYRKTHLYDPLLEHERVIFTAGESLSPIVSIKGVKCALLICWDVEIPEVCRVLAVRGAECFLVLTANNSELTNTITTRSRAIENNAFVVYTNLVGSFGHLTFAGMSVAYGPDGTCLAMASSTEEDVKIAVIDPTQDSYQSFIKMNTLLIDRRPDLYAELSTVTD